MARRKYYPGYVSDGWTIIELPYKSKKALMRCKCGFEKWNWISNISSHKSKGCWKCSHKTGAEQTFKSVTRTAARRGLEWNITFDDWLRLSQENCNYCGNKPSNYILRYEFAYNGIDRIDSSKGYTLDNCVPCCRVCNRSKSDMTLTEFIEWIGRVHARSI